MWRAHEILCAGHSEVDVDSSIVFGLRLRRYGPSGDMLEMEAGSDLL